MRTSHSIFQQRDHSRAELCFKLCISTGYEPWKLDTLKRLEREISLRSHGRRGMTAPQKQQEAEQEMEAAERRHKIHKTLQLNQFPLGTSIWVGVKELPHTKAI